ncbi:hypothetical protein B0H11DRAFT_1918334 [Mycena galericulata]|nr:hypothetical protein B0H11DRAFT_1918334 [Mycena galericulata]
MEGGHEVIELLSDSDEEMLGEFFQPHYTSTPQRQALTRPRRVLRVFSPYPDLVHIKTGTELTLVEALENAYVVDQNTADEIATAFRMGVLTNPHNGVTHRMARNSQRQSKIAQKARESQERNTERKDLEA